MESGWNAHDGVHLRKPRRSSIRCSLRGWATTPLSEVRLKSTFPSLEKSLRSIGNKQRLQWPVFVSLFESGRPKSAVSTRDRTALWDRTLILHKTLRGHEEST